MIFSYLISSLFGTGIFLTAVANSGLPSISESDVAQSVVEDIENLKPSVMMQTLKEISPFLLAIAYNIAVVVIVLFISSRIIKLLSKMLDKFLKKINVDLAVRRFLISTLKVIMYALIIMALAERLGINQATIVAVLGSAGVAIGLAWQGSLSNFAGGMIILVSRPFSR